MHVALACTSCWACIIMVFKLNFHMQYEASPAGRGMHGAFEGAQKPGTQKGTAAGLGGRPRLDACLAGQVKRHQRQPGLRLSLQRAQLRAGRRPARRGHHMHARLPRQ